MSSLVLIPWPKTRWSEAGRIASRTPLPLSEAGREQARAWAAGIADSGLSVVYSSKEPVSVETALIVADRTRAKHKTMSELAEVDAGLWDGLTDEELKRRDPKVYKRWLADPAGVRPPNGEDVAAAFERLRDPVNRVTRKQGDRAVGLVLGPLAFALVRCILESVEPSQVRLMMHEGPLRYRMGNGDGAAVQVVATGGAA